MSECRSCGRPVVWVRTTTNKDMPVDPEPRDDGNVVVTGGGPLVDHCTVLIIPHPERSPRYVSHFVTCPHAEKWRRT